VTTFDRVKKASVEQLGVNEDEVIPAASLVDDLELKWRDPVEFIMALEEEFGIKIPDEAFVKLRTVADLVRYIDAKTMAQS
jgi:acyl carrier protein